MIKDARTFTLAVRPCFCIAYVIGRLIFKIMPDITMCTNEDCPISYSCWRFNCPPSKYAQSYQKFEPKIDEVLDEVECKMYLETPNNEKSDVVRLWG